MPTDTTSSTDTQTPPAKITELAALQDTLIRFGDAMKSEAQNAQQSDPINGYLQRLVIALFDPNPQHLDTTLTDIKSKGLSPFSMLTHVPLPGVKDHQIPLSFIPILLNRPNVLNTLLTHHFPPNCRDSEGMAALHMAQLLQLTDASDQLRKAGADPKAKNQHNQTPGYIRCLRLGIPFPKDGLQIGPTHMPNHSAFTKHFNTRFEGKTRYDADTLLLWWAQKPVQKRPFFTDTIAHPPSRALANNELKISLSRYNHALQQSAYTHPLLPQQLPNTQSDYHATASHALKKGQVIEYSGLHAQTLASKSDRNHPGLDASQHGSGAEWINDGFPNAKYITYNDTGLPRILVLITEDIPKTHSICAHYGPAHSVKGWQDTGPSRYIPLRWDHIPSFLDNTQGLQTFNGLDENGGYSLSPKGKQYDPLKPSDKNKDWDELLTRIHHQNQFRYLCETPLALLHVVFEHNVQLNQTLVPQVSTLFQSNTSQNILRANASNSALVAALSTLTKEKTAAIRPSMLAAIQSGHTGNALLELKKQLQ